MVSIKEINVRICTYYFFDDTVNINNLDPNQIKIDKSYKISLFITLVILLSKILAM